MGALSFGDDKILDKVDINNQSRSAWGEVSVYGRSSAADENAKESSISGMVIQAGGNIISNKTAQLGVYAGYANSTLEQAKSKGAMTETGLGVYGGIFSEIADIKGKIYAGMASYEITRELELLGLGTKGELSGYNIRLELEAVKEIEINRGYALGIFGRVKGGYAISAGGTENSVNDSAGAEMDIYANNYLRGEIEGGIGIKYLGSKLGWYVKGYAGYLAAGGKPIYEGEFKETGSSVEIWGTEESAIGLGASAGIEYDITKRINVSAGVSFKYSETTTGYLGNVGVSYKFGEIVRPARGNVEEAYSKAINEAIANHQANEEWDIKRSKIGKVTIVREKTGKLKVNKNSKIYLITYGNKVYAYNSEEKARNFYNKLKSAGARLDDETFKIVPGVELIE